MKERLGWRGWGEHAGGWRSGRERTCPRAKSPVTRSRVQTEGLLLASRGRVQVWVSPCNGGGKVGRSPGMWWLRSGSSSQIVALVNMATRIFLDEKVALGSGFTITQWVGPRQCPGKKIDSELTSVKANCWVQKLLFCSPILLCN